MKNYETELTNEDQSKATVTDLWETALRQPTFTRGQDGSMQALGITGGELIRREALIEAHCDDCETDAEIDLERVIWRELIGFVKAAYWPGGSVVANTIKTLIEGMEEASK